MTFPVDLDLFGLHVHPHPVFEAAGYFLGYQVYRRARKRQGDVLSDRTRWSVVLAAAFGGVLGSKILFWLIDPAAMASYLSDLRYWMSGKTMVGGLLGAVAAVELAKWRLGIRVRTGDLFAIPLLVGLAIGRIGCFLTGLDDLTYGVETTLPWGVDFGDGVRRHPTQIYEMVAVTALAVGIRWRSRQPYRVGDLFRLALVGYLAWRLVIDLIKPGPSHLGLTSIQWACVVGLCAYAREIPRILGMQKVVLDEPA